jgi:poly-beta-1,6-N-acetyl-D-glucosamine synthase
MILIIFLILLCCILGIHITYPLLLKRLSHNKVIPSSYKIVSDFDISDSSPELPIVSVIIPVYNEELVIERRINNIFESKYPKNKLEVLLVESGSTDKSRSIIQEKFPNRVILICEEQRRGKAHAINLALKTCKGEIQIITDGPTLFDKYTILQLVNSLKNTSVGGASVLYNIPNANENQITASEYAFWSYKDKIRVLESRAYSTSWLSGEACAFKKCAISKVDEDTLADDSNIALQIISKGFRVVINENSYFTEKSPSEFYDYFKIKSRRALGGLRETLRFKFLLFRPKYGYFGLVIFPYRFFVQFISPVASYIAMVLFVPATIEISVYFGIYTVLFISTVLTSIAFLFRSKVIAYFYLQLITSKALFLFLTRRIDVKWFQSRTTRL